MKKIPYTKPSITDLEISYATDAAANGWGEKCYDYINKFEINFATHIDVKYAIATSSCTGAMTMGLDAIGIQACDEVILADTNWIATTSPIVHKGAKPVFVDILPDTWCIDPEQAEAAITHRTKAIIATHLYGNLCDMDKLLAIGEKYGIAIIEDAAEAIGSTYNGRKAGSMGTFSTFSFHGTKTLTTGEGGIFLTNDRSIYEKVLSLSNHGRILGQTKQFWADLAGYKFKMSNIQAAIGCAQLERIEDLVARKKSILSSYKKQLSDRPEISMNPEYNGTTNGSWMPNVVFSRDSGVSRETLQKAFSASGIDARVFFWPLSSLPMFETNHKNVHAFSISDRSINLPSFHDMTDETIHRIIGVIKKLKYQ